MTKSTCVSGIAIDQLKSIIARAEKLESEKADIAADIRGVFAEAKHNGFEAKANRTVIKMRKMDAQGIRSVNCLLALSDNLGGFPLRSMAWRADREIRYWNVSGGSGWRNGRRAG